LKKELEKKKKKKFYWPGGFLALVLQVPLLLAACGGQAENRIKASSDSKKDMPGSKELNIALMPGYVDYVNEI